MKFSVVQYSDEILHLICGPDISGLTVCGANELEALPNYLDSAIWNYFVGLVSPDTAVLHLDVVVLRQYNSAVEAYKMARVHLLLYVEGVERKEHRITAYLNALAHFEYCIGSVWRAVEFFNKMEHKVLKIDFKGVQVFKGGDNSDLERLNLLNGELKHFSIDQAAQRSAPIWITNEGLSCTGVKLSFDELKDNIVALSEVCKQTFIEIPNEAVAIQQRKQPKS